ncbi:expressed unknown protein [Seminavis robusta]|uniref:Uncharacterized protein n=1 Tax=Seminavis robusta TaxID=568900 RepID=A0A9N8DGZ8_9STRA|nr:expressed unknown protein [Seminavis robusta]|eukprot:Sro138_g064700.1 n/a (387) ;mRNA; r:38095-39255
MKVISSLKDHAVRAALVLTFPKTLFSPMGEVELTEDERRVLNTSFLDMLWQSGFSKSFLVWRRRLLYSASVFFAVGAGIRISTIQEQCGGFIGEGFNHETQAYETSTGEDVANYTGLGKAAVASQRVAPFCALAVVLVAAWFWTDYTKSRNVLVPGWLLTLLLSLWPTMIPLNYVLKESTFSKNAFLGATYAFGILPTYLSIIAGLTLGSKRVFLFAPSPLSGAMVVLSAVFAIITPFAALSLIIQVLGDFLLVMGICCLVIGPVLIVSFASPFTEVSTFGSSERILFCNRLLSASGICRGAGMALVLIWAIRLAIWATNYTDVTNQELSSLASYIVTLMDPKMLVGMTCEFLGGMMFNAVLWTDIVVHVSRNDDIKMQKLQSDLS